MNIGKAWLIAACFGLAAAQFIGCDGGGTISSSSANNTSSSSGEAGAGGSGGNGGSGGMASSSSGNPPECMADAECMNNGPTNFCGAPACENGKCIRKGLQSPGTALPSQTYGDCLEKQCDTTFNIADVADDTDIYDDGNDCTEDVCSNGVFSSTPKTMGTLCNGQAGVCTEAGVCVQCLDGAQGCGTQTCVMNKCVPTTCTNGMKNAGEGDIDCGGNCVPCAEGKTCTSGAQCATGVCTSGMCAAPTCMDGVRNGNETDTDCGGECSACATDLGCKAPSDCQSGVCISAYCNMPTCFDAVKNGDEQGVDCGGACADACP